jgi:hypothetical protein
MAARTEHKTEIRRTPRLQVDQSVRTPGSDAHIKACREKIRLFDPEMFAMLAPDEIVLMVCPRHFMGSCNFGSIDNDKLKRHFKDTDHFDPEKDKVWTTVFVPYYAGEGPDEAAYRSIDELLQSQRTGAVGWTQSSPTPTTPEEEVPAEVTAKAKRAKRKKAAYRAKKRASKDKTALVETSLRAYNEERQEKAEGQGLVEDPYLACAVSSIPGGPEMHY